MEEVKTRTQNIDKFRVLSGSWLKIIATAAMLIDHIAAVFLRSDPVALFTVFGRTLTLYALLRGIGRIAFPIYAFLITEGFIHTGDRKRYGISLALFALISEVPWDLVHHDKFFSIASQNVFFTLFLGYLAICMAEKYREKPFIQAAWLIGLLIVSLLLRADYGISGYCFIVFMYALRERELLRAVIGCGFLSSRWKAGLAFIPIALYNGKRGFIRGPVAKYFFYVFYPLHLLVLYLIKVYC
ncbi:MAG: TraX protein [Clostridia bacterium]|nr:TraX protein [Clostridia bacterium]